MECTPLPLALVVVVSTGSGRVLFTRRKGFYELPGGKIRCGENPAEAASRELLEETRVKLDPRLLKLKGAVALRGYEGEPVLALVFSVEVGSELPCMNCAWLDPRSTGLNLAPGTGALLRAAGVGGKDL